MIPIAASCYLYTVSVSPHFPNLDTRPLILIHPIGAETHKGFLLPNQSNSAYRILETHALHKPAHTPPVVSTNPSL